jgi:DNA end-binding protein Ku
MGDVLTMATMRFADEVVTPGELEDVLGEEVEAPKKKELEMAKALIDSLTSDFDAGQYRDEYREELLALIESKARGEAIAAPAGEAPKPTKAPDLMAALEESLAAVKGEEDKSKPAKPAAKSGSKTSSKSKRTPSRSRSKAKAAK